MAWSTIPKSYKVPSVWSHDLGPGVLCMHMSESWAHTGIVICPTFHIVVQLHWYIWIHMEFGPGLKCDWVLDPSRLWIGPGLECPVLSCPIGFWVMVATHTHTHQCIFMAAIHLRHKMLTSSAPNLAVYCGTYGRESLLVWVQCTPIFSFFSYLSYVWSEFCHLIDCLSDIIVNRLCFFSAF